MRFTFSRSQTIGVLAIVFGVAACAESDEPAPAPTDAASVTPTAETTPVASGDDAADDPAIWVHPDDPSKSLIIGTDKRRGLVVYDLSGAVVYENEDGRMNNVDVRSGISVTTDNARIESAIPMTIVAATNRTNKTIAVYMLDPESGALFDILDEPIPSNFEDPYGLCLYHSAASGALFVFANDKDGTVSQWQLYDSGRGTLRSTIQRTWELGSQPEGCVADDANGWLFIGEEEIGVWRYGAEPKDSFEERAEVARTGLGRPGGARLSADVEGLSLYVPPGAADDEGYLIASSQGNWTYVVFDRKPPHAYRGTFTIDDNTENGVDGTGETDGLDVSAVPLGPDYPAGLLVVQDGFNTDASGKPENQNFKYVSWQGVAEALDLP